MNTLAETVMPFVKKTSVFLAFDYGGDYDGKNNKKTHQEKQYKFAVKVLSFLANDLEK